MYEWFLFLMFKKLLQHLKSMLKFLPLVAIVAAGALPLSPAARHWLVAATLVWFNVFMVFEVFSS